MRAGYDEVIFFETGRLIPCDVVHHIEPIAERPDLRDNQDAPANTCCL